MSKIKLQGLAGIFKEIYGKDIDKLIPGSLKMFDPNYDPVINELENSSLGSLKETLGYVPKDNG